MPRTFFLIWFLQLFIFVFLQLFIGVWGGVPSPMGRGLGRGHCPSPENFSILSLKMAKCILGPILTVHSSMDCLKRFRRQKPLLVGKLVCMQIALGGKTSVLETTL